MFELCAALAAKHVDKQNDYKSDPSMNFNSENLQILHGFIKQTEGGVQTWIG